MRMQPSIAIATSTDRPTWATAWPVIAGLLVLFGPSLYDLATGLWLSEDHSHGLLVFGVVLWLLWSQRSAFTLPARPWPLPGWLLLGFGLVLYVLGRSQDILLVEIGAAFPVLAGTALLTYGTRLLRRFAFLFVLLLFLLPLPGFLVDALTTPLKHQVSAFAANLLYAVGYPIAKSGVVLHLGPYQLLVADACSGMRSIYSLAATGMVYLYLTGHRNPLRVALMVLSIVPIAFFANSLRVVTLALITFHMGDAAAQSYLHDLAGISLYLFALGLLLALDGLLGLLPWLRDTPARVAPPAHREEEA